MKILSVILHSALYMKSTFNWHSFFPVVAVLALAVVQWCTRCHWTREQVSKCIHSSHSCIECSKSWIQLVLPMFWLSDCPSCIYKLFCRSYYRYSCCRSYSYIGLFADGSNPPLFKKVGKNSQLKLFHVQK